MQHLKILISRTIEHHSIFLSSFQAEMEKHSIRKIDLVAVSLAWQCPHMLF